MKKGFSLLEILVGMGLMAVIMAAGVVMLFASLRTSKKAANVGAAKSEGAYAINAMSQKIRYAQAIDCSVAKELKVNLFDDSTTTYKLISTLGVSQLAADNTDKNGVTTRSFLTSVKVNVADCSGLFACTPVGAVTPSAVTICFNVTAVSGTTDVTEAGSAAFQTKVSLRNYGN